MSSTLRFPTTFPCRFVSFVRREAFRLQLTSLFMRETKQTKSNGGFINDISYRLSRVLLHKIFCKNKLARNILSVSSVKSRNNL